MKIPIITDLLQHRGRRRLWRLMRGYRYLKESNQLGRITAVKEALTNTKLNQCERRASKGLATAELAFDYPKRVFNFGSDAGFEFLQLFNEPIDRRCFIQCLAFPRHHGHFPINPRVLGLYLFSLGYTTVARVSEDNLFFPMQQSMGLGDIVVVGWCGGHGVNQARLSIYPNVGLHADATDYLFWSGAYQGHAHPYCSWSNSALQSGWHRPRCRL